MVEGWWATAAPTQDSEQENHVTPSLASKLPRVCAALLIGASVLACIGDTSKSSSTSSSEPSAEPAPSAQPEAKESGSAFGPAPTCAGGDAVSCMRDAEVAWSRGEKDKALGLYARSCEGGHQPACDKGNAAKTTKPGIRPMVPSELQENCDKGRHRACGTLGQMYHEGLNGVTKDYVRGAMLYQKACDNGVLEACFNLAQMYKQGQGLQRDDAKVVMLAKKTCDGGIDMGCSLLGVYYMEGRGVPKDALRAASLFQGACDKGDVTGCTGLGALFLNGQGVKQDLPRARKLFEGSCAKKEEEACRALRLMESKGF